MGRVAEQRRRAAAIGTEVRSRRAEVKRWISEGKLALTSLLRGAVKLTGAAQSTAEEIPVGQLLRSVRGIGPATAAEILADLQLNPDRPMSELTEKQRELLATEIERT